MRTLTTFAVILATTFASRYALADEAAQPEPPPAGRVQQPAPASAPVVTQLPQTSLTLTPPALIDPIAEQRAKYQKQRRTGIALFAISTVGAVMGMTALTIALTTHEQYGLEAGLGIPGALLSVLVIPGFIYWFKGAKGLAELDKHGAFSVGPTTGTTGVNGAAASYTFRF